MKKIYMTPEMEAIEIKNKMTLLAGSPILGGGGIADDLGSGGADGDGSLDPDAPGLPGMPDFGPSSVMGFPF